MYRRQYNCDKSALKHIRCSYQRYALTAQSSDIVSSYEQKQPALSALNYRVNCRRSALSRLNRVQLTLSSMQLRCWAVYMEQVLARMSSYVLAVPSV